MHKNIPNYFEISLLLTRTGRGCRTGRDGRGRIFVGGRGEKNARSMMPSLLREMSVRVFARRDQ